MARRAVVVAVDATPDIIIGTIRATIPFILQNSFGDVLYKSFDLEYRNNQAYIDKISNMKLIIFSVPQKASSEKVLSVQIFPFSAIVYM